MATKREFTAQDMKKAFEAGARIADGGSWAWQRWMRAAYPARYVRKRKLAKHKTGKGKTFYEVFGAKG